MLMTFQFKMTDSNSNIFHQCRCETDGVDMESGAKFTIPALLAFYQKISKSNSSPMSESAFREYAVMEREFTAETKQFLEKVFTTRASNCITKANLLVIAKKQFEKVRMNVC